MAGVAHALLFLALGVATAWKIQTPTVQAQAELWAATPQAAAPRQQEPSPEPAPEPAPPPQPKPTKPTKPTPPPPPAPDRAQERRDAQIALEKKKQQDKKEADKAEKLKAEKEKAELKRKAREKEDKAKENAAKEQQAQENKERDKKKAAEKAKTDKADAARAEALRQENLQRMQGLAGASGSDKANDATLKSTAPSASYAGRVVGRIKPNITYPGDVLGNPRAEVEVKVSLDGTILSRRIVQASGNKAWDDAVLRAVDKTAILPKDTDGRVPPVIVLGFRLLD